ncbi:hypothetical protein C8R45DRAFT_1083840 [Mycena sanguinolenta]|nr:hypothetical protein C8R45DRAFT_1083840 [Mycena sanguinolenta]
MLYACRANNECGVGGNPWSAAVRQFSPLTGRLKSVLTYVLEASDSPMSSKGPTRSLVACSLAHCAVLPIIHATLKVEHQCAEHARMLIWTITVWNPTCCFRQPIDEYFPTAVFSAETTLDMPRVLKSKGTDTKVNPTANKAKPTDTKANVHGTRNGGTAKENPAANKAKPVENKVNGHGSVNGGTAAANPAANKAKPAENKANGHGSVNGGTANVNPADNKSKPAETKANGHGSPNGGAKVNPSANKAKPAEDKANGHGSVNARAETAVQVVAVAERGDGKAGHINELNARAESGAAWDLRHVATEPEMR